MLLSDDILKWVINAVNQRATVQSIVCLKGSTSSTLHQITLNTVGNISNVVVRQFDNEAWLEEEPDLAFHEAESLRLAAQAGIGTPGMIAFDETGKACGVPVVLMTMLEGAVELKPDHMGKWLNGLATALTHIHDINANVFSWGYFTYNDVNKLEIPAWSSVPMLWEKAIDIAKGPRPEFETCFIHRDYHPANILWKDGVVSGVVDWVNACLGPAGIDVSHCRVNLAMLFDVQTADAFLRAYQQNAKTSFDYDVYWDIVSILDILSGPPTVYAGWKAFGVTGLTDKMMEERLDRYIESLIV